MMGFVNDAFDNLKTGLEINATESALAISRRETIYEHLKTEWDLTSVFLTGSYARHTKTKKLKDVDIFAVIDPQGNQSNLAKTTPTSVLNALKTILNKMYDGKVSIDGVACVIQFGAEEITSFEIVPAFLQSDKSYKIPDSSSGSWISTDPTKHADATTAKNKLCDGKWIPFVKMLKGTNREAGEPISPSFLIEVMALTLVREPFGRYQDEIAGFFASAADQIVNDWPDPAGLGPAVNNNISAGKRTELSGILRGWQHKAEAAIDLEDEGRERAAVDAWRELFGSRMPRP